MSTGRVVCHNEESHHVILEDSIEGRKPPEKLKNSNGILSEK